MALSLTELERLADIVEAAGYPALAMWMRCQAQEIAAQLARVDVLAEIT